VNLNYNTCLFFYHLFGIRIYSSVIKCLNHKNHTECKVILLFELQIKEQQW